MGVQTLTLATHLHRRHLAAAVAGGAALVVVGLVDPSRQALGPPCPLKLLTGLDCPLCGATRATHQLLRGDLTAALDFNALYVAALPLVAAVALFWVLRGRRPAWADNRWVPWAVGAVAALFGVLRNLPFAPLSFLAT
ncbi:MAG: DUF2752 domain-containing protein [Actinobacteria bacterium]|nr:DUF2752 domain-containing protein [Actinomycetota bacterium]